MTSKLLKKVASQDAIDAAWRVIQNNARTSTSASVRQEVDEFAEAAGQRIRSICWRLSRNRFEFGTAKGVPVPKFDSIGRKTGKFRPIVLASVEARIVQRSVLEVLQSISSLDQFIKTPFSFGGMPKTTSSSPRGNKDNPSAVPAAIKAVLDSIEGGTRFYVCADIKSFFTRISKPRVTEIIASAVDDSEFMEFFSKAIATELSNMAELRDLAADFPIYEIGVAQGNSLSSLLGNIALAKFDVLMNEGDCCCIRYIDDFVILGPSYKAVNARLRRAMRLLHELGMELSPEKTSNGARAIKDGLSFLGVEIAPGIIRPSGKAQQKFLNLVESEFADARKAFREFQAGKEMKKSRSLISTLKRVEGIVDGWGKHYWFCNDLNTRKHLDSRVSDLIREFLGAYRDVRLKTDFQRQNLLLGVPMLATQNGKPYKFPSVKF